MRQKTQIGIISGSAFSKGMLKIITKKNLSIGISEFKDINSFKNSDRSVDILFAGPFDMDQLNEVLSILISIKLLIPSFIILSDEDDNPNKRLELLKRGADGFVRENEYESAINFIVKEIIKGSYKADSSNSVKNEILNYYLDNSNSMISVINNEHKYESVNSLFCERFNRKREDLIGSSPSELWGDKMFEEKIKSNLERSLNGEIVRYKANFDISGVPGKFYEVMYLPVIPENSEAIFSIVETKDITLEELESEKVKAREGKYYLLEKYLPMGVFECKRDGKILEANNTFKKILEINNNKIPGLNLKDFFHADNRFIDYIAKCEIGEASTFSNLQCKTVKGNEIYVRINSHVWKVQQDEVIINATFEDTTREVMLERKLNQSHRMETLGTLAGGIAHDFNTILTTITGYSELTMDEVDKDSDIYKYMTKLNIVAKRAEDIINQMLLYSQQVEQQLDEVDVEIVLQEAIQFIRSAIPYSISLKQEFDTIDKVVMADPTQLFRVFINIITNATHAMDKKGGILGISLKSSISMEKDCIEICISDTGHGIERAIIDRIFEPFFTTKELDKGSGMGLSVSHGIINGIGGEISVTSEVGKGSSFIVRLPAINKTKK